MKRKTIVLLLIIVCAVLLGSMTYMYLSADHTPPVVQFTADVPSYTQGEDTDVLLRNLRAYDFEDGDVSDKATVDSVTPQSNGKSAKVFYIVRDSSNNMTTASQVVPYIEKDDSSETKDSGDEN